MEIESLKHKKRIGDIMRITELVNLKRIARQEKPYSKETIAAMLRGARRLKPEVAAVRNEFYTAIENLTSN